jgi:hypothetical protein
VVALLLSSACGAPAIVDGIVEDNEFSIRDTDPELRPQADDGVIVVIAEEAGSQLRVVQLKLPSLEGHEPGESILIEDRALDRTWLTAASGTLDETIRSDGVRVVNTLDARVVAAVRGHVECEQSDGLLTGTLTAELEDGGWVEGSFVAPID